jgi:hypothetical protein
MGLISYIQNIPGSANNPSNDQPNMLLNTNALFNYLAVDHVPFNVNNSGFHTVIHQTIQGSDPVTLAGFGQLYTKNVTIGSVIDNQLFYKTGLGIISQLTGGSSIANGSQYIGGILIQWGIATIIASSGLTVVFPIPYVNPAFTVQCTGRVPDVTTTSIISISNISNTQFTAFSATATVPNGDLLRGSNATFYWLAIGI